MTPEQKAARFARIKKYVGLGRKLMAGRPRGWTTKEYKLHRIHLRRMANQQLRRMMRATGKKKGTRMSEEYVQLASDDKLAKEAMIQTLMVMKDPTTPAAMRLQAARTILEWTKSKPATKNEHVVKRPEDFLAALAAQETNGPVIIEHQEEAPRQLPLLRAPRPDDQDEAGHG